MERRNKRVAILFLTGPSSAFGIGEEVATHGRCWIRVVGPLGLLTLLIALSVSPAFGALPYGYAPVRVDSPSPQDGARFGGAVVDIGDLNADGVDDLAVGSPGANDGQGAVFLVSGKDGSPISAPAIQPPDLSNGGQPAGFGTSISAIGDYWGCPGFGGTPGQDCDAEGSDMNTPDTIPDLIVGAPGVDLTPGGEDTGRVYVIDGGNRAVIRRIDMPSADQTAQTEASGHPAFGQAVLVPRGLPPCTGNGGVGTCDGTIPTAVKIGDLDGTGKPDLVVGAPNYFVSGGGPDPSPACVQVCVGAGRAYVYRGETIGAAPDIPLTTAFAIKVPAARTKTPNSDTPPTWFGQSLAAAGDIGRCAEPSPSPLSFCTGTDTLDSKPDFVISAPHADSSTGEGEDIGVAYVFDYSTKTFVQTIDSPGPNSDGLFGFGPSGGRALGDFAGDAHWDLLEGAPGEANHYGHAYVFNGDLTKSPDLLDRLDDPTPTAGSNFGGAWAAAGDVEGDSHNEVLVGTAASSVAGEVQIFSGDAGVLQSVSDPDSQAGSEFGGSIAPLGDVNGDGFLDFAVGAAGFGSGKGRLYIFRSDNTPPPPPPPPGSGGNPPPPGGNGTVTAASRSVVLSSSRKRIRSGQGVRFRGSLRALANRDSCEPRQTVEIQRRRSSRGRYQTFVIVTTDISGRFAVKAHPPRTYSYRARVRATDRCLRAFSGVRKVAVKRKRRG